MTYDNQAPLFVDAEGYTPKRYNAQLPQAQRLMTSCAQGQHPTCAVFVLMSITMYCRQPRDVDTRSKTIRFFAQAGAPSHHRVISYFIMSFKLTVSRGTTLDLSSRPKSDNLIQELRTMIGRKSLKTPMTTNARQQKHRDKKREEECVNTKEREDVVVCEVTMTVGRRGRDC